MVAVGSATSAPCIGLLAGVRRMPRPITPDRSWSPVGATGPARAKRASPMPPAGPVRASGRCRGSALADLPGDHCDPRFERLVAVPFLLTAPRPQPDTFRTQGASGKFPKPGGPAAAVPGLRPPRPKAATGAVARPHRPGVRDLPRLQSSGRWLEASRTSCCERRSPGRTGRRDRRSPGGASAPRGSSRPCFPR
jgi:hypothetical protein